MAALNYHHLRYFWVIAKENNLTRAAERLHVSQSALSIQLRKLEESLGQTLFDRDGKRLLLTEAGRIALDYADAIFSTGDELLSLMHNRPGAHRQLLRVGAVSTLSRNFQLELMRPLLSRTDIELVLHAGSLPELLARMHTHTLDLVLSNRPVPPDAEANWHCHLLDEQSVSLVGHPQEASAPFRFPQDLQSMPLLLPGIESEIRAAFDFLLDHAGIRPLIIAEVDDMAMLRLLSRESGSLALVPPVVVQDELRDGLLVERYRIPEIRERFYAITPTRRFPNAILRELLAGFSRQKTTYQRIRGDE
ncbi:MAG: LysR family transcriptional regulator [Candidatus Methylumidiphilus sp.]